MSTNQDNDLKLDELKNELIQKKLESEKLKSNKTQKSKQISEESLKKKLISYDLLINKIKTALDIEQQQKNETNECFKLTNENVLEVDSSLMTISNHQEETNLDKKELIHEQEEEEEEKEAEIETEEDSKSNNRLQEVTDKLLELKIPFSRRKIHYLSDLAIETYFWSLLEKNFPIKLIQEELINEENEFNINPNLIEYFKSLDENEENKSIELIFKKMLLDLIAELMHDLYLERYEHLKPMFKYFPGLKKNFKKQYFKSHVKGPVSLNETKLVIRQKLTCLLKLNEINNNNNNILNYNQQVKSKWRLQKRLDLVDSILDSEMRDQEYEWSNYEMEEYEAKTLITNSIFDLVLKDTIECFQLNFNKKLNINVY